MQASPIEKTFKGGYCFKPFKGEIENRVVSVAIPETVVIPLRQGYGEEVPAIVKAGANVKAGTVIGRDDSSISTPVVSSISGVVKEICTIFFADGETKAVVVKSDGRSAFEAMPRDYTDYRTAGADQIERMLYEGGLTALGEWGLPTRYNTGAVTPDAVKRIIITAVPTEPFIMTNQVLLSNSLRRFAIGCEILRTFYRPESMHLAMSGRDQMLVQKMRAELAELKVTVHEVSRKHPQAFSEIVTETCLDVKVPDHGRAIDMGVLVIDAQVVLHVHDAIVEGKPLIERMVALGGGAYSGPCAATVRIGTMIKDIVDGSFREGIEPRIVLNSSLTGPKILDHSLPVDRTVSAVIALEEFRERPFMHFVRTGADYDSNSNSFLGKITSLFKRSDTNLGGELRACISCGYCEEVCPRDLMPHYLSKCINADLPEEAEMVRIFGCIECGLCSYVCPSKIPLMDDIIKGKKIITAEEEEFRKRIKAAEEERIRSEKEKPAEEDETENA